MTNKIFNLKTFYPFYEERIASIINKIKKEIDPAEMPGSNVWLDLDSILYEIFHKAAVRTLIVEMHECLDQGRIIRSTPEEEYLVFTDRLKREEYREDILTRYTGLAKLLDTLEENQYRFWSEFFVRLRQDGCLPGKLSGWAGKAVFVRKIEANASDPHLKGRMVVRVVASDGSCFFYKPHGMGNEIFLQDLIEKICRDLGWKRRRHRIWDKGDYGWAEEISCAPCEQEEEVQYFFQKAGMLSAVSYVLGMGDLHYENIIANGDDPVIVDTETLFQYMTPLYQWNEKENIFYSVLSSGLFPGGNVGKNVSGIMGGEGYQYEREVPVILNDKTSEMRVGYAKPVLKKGKNRVQFQNINPELSQYEGDILHGFDLTYQWFLKNRRQVMEMIRSREKELYSRYISGATQFFGMGLSASTHPQLLTDPNGREAYLDKITDGRQLHAWEKRAMLEGDIPWFGRRMNDRNLYSGQEVSSSDFFEHTLSEELEQRLAQLTREDNILQQRALSLSIVLFEKEEKWINSAGSRIADRKGSESALAKWEKGGSERALRAAKEIAEEIMGNAVRDRGKIFWLSIASAGEQMVIRPADHYFYSGIGGIAVFFRTLCKVYPEYEEVSSALEKMLFSYTDKVSGRAITPNTRYTGMYCGEASVPYAWQLLYQITKDDKYLFYAGKHLHALSNLIEEDRRFDLLYGNAGLILILCQQYLYTKDVYYKKEADRALDVLERNCRESDSGVVWEDEGNENSVCSIAHGNSGILLAYARLNFIMPDPKYVKRMKQIVSYEDQFYDERTGNWADLRKKGEEAYNTYAWCNGGLGVLYARLQAAKWNPGEKWLEEEVRRSVPLCRNMRLRQGMCLCHGNMGNLLILKAINEYLADSELADLQKQLLEAVYEELEGGFAPRMPQERYGAGMMNGLSGMGLAFMELMG